MSLQDGPARSARLARSVRLQDLVLIPLIALGTVGLTSWALSMALHNHFAPDPIPMLVAEAMVFGLLLLQAYLLVVLIRLLVMDKHQIDWQALGLMPVALWRWMPVAVLAALLLLGVTVSINLALSTLLEDGFQNPQQDLVATMSTSWLGIAGLILVAGLIAPFTEEHYFRGLLFPWLRARTGFPAAAAISALVFSLLHATWVLIPAIFVVGLALAYMRERSGSLWPGYCCHALFNSISLMGLFVAQSIPAAPPALP